MDSAIIAQLRLMIGTTTFTDEELWTIYQSSGLSLNNTAAKIWEQKATNTVSLVDISESGSSRKMSDVHKQTVAMAEYYRKLANNESGDGVSGGRRRGRVNYIERP